MLFQSGVKLNRIGQWGDKTDWATVEKTKGTYVIEPDIDRGVSDCVEEWSRCPADARLRQRSLSTA